MNKTLSIIALLLFVVFAQLKVEKANLKLLPKQLRENYSWIPNGNAVIGNDTVNVHAFYISKTEVSQKQYAAFLADVKQSGDMEKYAVCRIDSTGWQKAFSFSEPYVKNYHTHEAYTDYPVVNISHEAAMAYCEWLSGRIKQALGEDYEVSATLPSREQWIRAARGDKHSFVYSWGGPFLRNNKGCNLCNYSQVGEENITKDPKTNKLEISEERSGNYMGVPGMVDDNADILAVCYSYSPNEFGLYAMNGNAAEMIAEKGRVVGGAWTDAGYDVRVESIRDVEGISPDVGFRPVFYMVKK